MASGNENWGLQGIQDNKAFASLRFQSVRIQEKHGNFTQHAHHNDILTSAVDHHHRSMTHAHPSVTGSHQQHLSEVRRMNSTAYEEVDVFESDDDDEDEDTDDTDAVKGGDSPRRANTPGSLLDAGDNSTPSRLGGGAGGRTRKALQPLGGASMPDMDPVSMLRRMRSEKSSRSMHTLTEQHHPALSVVKGPGHHVVLPEDCGDEDVSAQREVSALRGKSFLTRSDGAGMTGGSAADGMLAQIRGGSKWKSDGIPAACKAKSFVHRESSASGTGIISQRPEVSFSSGSVPGSAPAPGLSGLHSKSFTAGLGKRPSALPGVSVDACQRGGASGEGSPLHRSPLSQAATSPNAGRGDGPRSGGFLSKLKSIMNRS